MGNYVCVYTVSLLHTQQKEKKESKAKDEPGNVVGGNVVVDQIRCIKLDSSQACTRCK